MPKVILGQKDLQEMNEGSLIIRKIKLYHKSILNLIEKKDFDEDRDAMKKLVFLCVKERNLYFKVVENGTYEAVQNDTNLFFTISNFMSLLTPREFMEVFPVEKRFDGEKYSIKDYFSTMKYIRKLELDEPIGDEEIDFFLMEYSNKEIFEMMIHRMVTFSDLRRFQGEKGVIEEFLEKEGVETFTKYDDVIVGNQTGKCFKVSKPRKRIPQQFKVIK